MILLMHKRTAGAIFAGIFCFGLTIGIYNFALHPNMHNWEKSDLLVKEVKIDEKVVALTFDDGPDPNNTPVMLDVLQKHNAKATFFIVGSRAEKQPELVKKLSDAGNEIANHSYSHANFNNKSDEFLLEEIEKTNDIIFRLSGQTSKLFRPPGGFLSNSLVELTEQEGIIIAYWTWQQDSKDWKPGTKAKKIADHIIDNIKPGQIIILHDGAANGMETAKAVDIFIPELKKQGYSFITMSELIKLENAE